MNHELTLLVYLSTLLFTSCLSPLGPQGRLPEQDQLREGDLLFHLTDQPNAITDVTPGMVDHVAILITPDSVIEAISQGVVTTSLDTVLARPGHYVAAKVRKANRRQSVQNARRYLGRSYDHLYLPDNDLIYCSELVLLSFVDRHGRHLLPPVPMTFRDTTGHITTYWRHHYSLHGIDVPEGLPGSNPSELLQRKEIKKLKYIE